MKRMDSRFPDNKNENETGAKKMKKNKKKRISDGMAMLISTMCSIAAMVLIYVNWELIG